VSWGLAAALLAAVGAGGCQSHSTLSSAPQKSNSSVAQRPAQSPVEKGRENSCREYVKRFYDWYSGPVKKDRRHPDGERNVDDSIILRNNYMNSRLYSLLKADRDAQLRSNEIVGLEFDPFTNSQDNSPTFEVKSAAVEGNNCRAVVWGVDAGSHRETVEPELSDKTGDWKFVNFYYPNEASPWNNLIDGLIFLRSERKNRKG
jgi:hypothetical protein